MPDLIPIVRNAPRAVIVRDGRILLLRKRGAGGDDRYALPGGGQEPGETLLEALQRECLEEIGTEVEVRDLLHLADFFKLRNTDPPTIRQLVEFLFLCEVPRDYEPHNGPRPDKHQVEVCWLDLQVLPGLALLPASLGGHLAASVPALSTRRDAAGVYLGEIA